MTDLTQALAVGRDNTRRFSVALIDLEKAYNNALAADVDVVSAMWMNLSMDCAKVSNDLIPRADADLAVALMVEKAAGSLQTLVCGHGTNASPAYDAAWAAGATFRAECDFEAIRALAPASALAELQALRDARTALTGDRATDFDNDAVYQFSKLMKDKMAKSRAKGRKGWNDPTQCSPDFLRHLLYEHIYKGDPVDVANLCMMLRHYDEPTTPKPEDDLRLLHTEAAEAELATLRAQVERLTGKLALVQRALEKVDEGLEYMGLYAPPSPKEPRHDGY